MESKFTENRVTNPQQIISLKYRCTNLVFAPQNTILISEVPQQ
ncbi:hypothetical protein SAMN00120144_1435 [Hymenobacter roseosalivarius DSM 11622]|uniref:Uncharacterized protein n=1 Tax=Hymenobacter roseosalivarius DSM 11622 TaxID=645990 RepID=A0A1W1V3B0_9BACT|nr:hypothetical protein SAMN00120144_1435 [Hymenobacter roseosalivarius DSM 11622]